MQFRQQRRRRVLTDEVARLGVAGDDPSAADGETAGGPRRETYTSQARRDEQPRLTDLVPTRRRVLAMWYAGGGLLIGVMQLLHARLDWFTAQLAPAVPRVLDLAERGSLAAWCSSAWLSITALVSVLLYSLRRHRIDDYRGRYRVWIWAALGWLTLAVNQTAPWDELVREVTLRGAAGIGLTQAWLWPVLCGTIAVAAAARLTIEMRDSILSLSLLWLGGLAWTVALVCPQLTNSLEPNTATMLIAGLTLAGQWTILSAHVAYARHVLLDAHGLIAPRETTPRVRLAGRTRKSPAAKPAADSTPSERPSAASAAKTSKPAATAPASATAKPAAASKAQPQAPSRLGVMADDSDEDDSDQQLSRAERKRLKRQQRGQYRDAA